MSEPSFRAPPDEPQREVSDGWIVWRNAVGWWFGTRPPHAPLTEAEVAFGCTHGVVGYADRSRVLSLIRGQELLRRFALAGGHFDRGDRGQPAWRGDASCFWE